MKEIFIKFPELIKVVMEKISAQQTNEKPYVKEARLKLMAQLQSTMDEIATIAQQDGQTFTEEQVKEMIEKMPMQNVDIFSILQKIGR